MSANELRPLSPSQITPELKERLKGICAGSSAPPASANDIPLILGSLKHVDLAVRKWGCLAVERIAAEKWFDARTARHVVTVMIPHLDCGDAECEDWAKRAIVAVAQRNPHYFDKDMYRQLATIAITLLTDDDAARRGRGAGILYHVAAILDPEQLSEAALALLAAAERPTEETFLDPNRKTAPSASLRTLNGVVYALTQCGQVTTNKLAENVAEYLLKAYDDKRLDSGTKRAVIWGLASFAPRLQGTMRERVLGTIVTSVSDGSLTYSWTSGLPSPLRHSGSDALVGVAPLLSEELLERAEKAIPPKETLSRLDRGMYEGARQALSRRRQQLTTGTQDTQNNTNLLDAYWPHQ